MTGVLLLNLGGPDSLEAVRPFLFNLFSDREIIRLGPPILQKPIAYLIAAMRHGKTEGFYSQIGGKSPIRELTEAQAHALEESLKCDPSMGRTGFKVYMAMRYWRPFIEDVVKEIGRDGIRRVLVLNLYPQYSVATTGSSLSRLNRCMSDAPFQIYSITSWFDNPLYIEALVEKIRKGLEGFEDGSPVHVLFSAHSLPERFILEGDPYADQIKGTIEMVAKKIEISWSLSYQSRSGPVKWLEPSTDATIEELAKRGVRNLLVVPISFVSDHIETLYEIDILYKTLALERGIRLQRAESLNTSPLFISALKDIVFRGLKEAGWEE